MGPCRVFLGDTCKSTGTTFDSTHLKVALNSFQHLQFYGSL